MSDSLPPGRPRSKTLVRIDLQNAYARLGVSPLLTTEEIKRFADQKRKDVMRKRRTRTQQQFGTEESEMAAIQEIEALIGTPKARAKYDQANPQNELLTVQPAAHDRWLDARHRDGLLSAWLLEELGPDAALPTPDSLALWAPHGFAPELLAFLRAFAPAAFQDAGAAPAVAPDSSDAGLLPSLADLDRLSTPNEEPNDG